MSAKPINFSKVSGPSALKTQLETTLTADEAGVEFTIQGGDTYRWNGTAFELTMVAGAVKTTLYDTLGVPVTDLGGGASQDALALSLGILDENGDPKTVLSAASNGFVLDVALYAGYGTAAAITETMHSIIYGANDNVTAFLIRTDGDANYTGMMVGLNFANEASAQTGMQPLEGTPPTAGNQYFVIDKSIGYCLINPGVLITRIWFLALGTAVNRTIVVPL